MYYARSFGIDEDIFFVHGAFSPRPVNRSNFKKTDVFEGSFLGPLVKKLNEYWPHPTYYGDISKYADFRSYQYHRHGQYTGMSAVDLFEAILNVVKDLPRDLGLSDEFVYSAGEALIVLQTVIGFRCEVRGSRISGYLVVGGRRYYNPVILDEIRICVDHTFSVLDCSREFSGVLRSLSDKFILPNVVIHREKTPGGEELLFVSGQVQHLMHKYKMEAEDKSRELWCMAEGNETTRFVILDAPALNMISGASQAEIGVLVISAREREFETDAQRVMHQHVQLAQTLGVRKLLVVVNKMDDPSVGWSEKRFNEIKSKMTSILQHSSFNVKKGSKLRRHTMMELDTQHRVF